MFSISDRLQQRKFAQYQQKCTKVELKIYQLQNKQSKNGQRHGDIPKMAKFAKSGHSEFSRSVVVSISQAQTRRDP